ncbi:MAG: hypothetical protein IV107_16465 [Paucibacter sp.]|nr:hypothetical protein [Roseateles sp.]
MSETLDFPEIDAPVRTEIAAAAANALDLSKINLTDVALAQFGKWREKSAEARKTLAGVQHDLSTQTKIDDAKSLRHRLINTPLAEARKVSKALKSKLNTVSAEVGAELTAIESDYADVALLITPQIEARELQLAEEKAERDRLAAERAAGFQLKIDAIRACAGRCQGISSERINNGIAHVEAIAVDAESFAEFAEEAANVKRITLAAMLNLRDLAKAREDEAARLEAQRAENARIAAEQAKVAEELAEQKRALDAQAAALAAQQKAIDDAKAEEAAKLLRQQEAEAAERAEEEAMRVRDEEARAKREAALSAPQPAPQPVAEFVGSEESDASCKTCNDHGLVGSAAQMDAVDCPDCAPAPVAAPVVRAIHPAAAALRNEAPTLTLGAMKDRLGFALTADFLADLGFEATPVKAARLYREGQFGDICAALVQHIESVRAEVALAA